MTYTTLYQVRDYLQSIGTEMSTDADAMLWRFIRQATRDIDVYCRRRFDVRLETRLFDYPIARRNVFGTYNVDNFVQQMNTATDLSRGMLRVDDDLLSVSSIVNGDGESITSDQYVLEAANRYPKYAVRLLSSSGVAWQASSDGDREQCISVTGVWGYHGRYREAWLDSLDTVQDDPLTSAATSLMVGAADGVDGQGDSPRFQVGQLLQIDDEYLDVLAVDTTTSVLTVKRAANGTTAAEHAQGAGIAVYQPEDSIVLAATRLAAWLFHQRDAPFSRVGNTATGEYEVPVAMPSDISARLDRFRREEDLA